MWKMKLKTLKDIESKILCRNPPTNLDMTSHDYGLIESFRELKQESIKWIKDARKNNETITERGWMDFFNIEDSDLHGSS